MRVAFKTWSEFDSHPQMPGDSKPSGIPDDWPAICNEIQDGDSAAYEADGWRVETKEDYEAYLNERRSSYLNWCNSQ